MDKSKVDRFWERQSKLKDPDLAARFSKNNKIEYDIELIRRYMPENPIVLDLGCGSCIITNELEPYASYICAVDKQAELFHFCVSSGKIRKVKADIVEYTDENKYDIIIIFGVFNYTTAEEMKTVCNNCRNMLKDEGYLIIKHACGVREDVYVDKFSEQLGYWYCAEYRHVAKEEELIKAQGFDVEVIDIYPAELNPWDNTHYYAFAAKKHSEAEFYEDVNNRNRKTGSTD